MQRNSQILRSLAKTVLAGAFVGIVAAIIFLALPAAGLILIAGSFNLNWNLNWIPSAGSIMMAGGILGGLFAAGLFIKDRFTPYVEEVPDFESDAEDPEFLNRDE